MIERYLFSIEMKKTRYYNRIDAGLVAGVGLYIDNITMRLRYNMELIKVGKSQSVLGTKLYYT